MAQQSTTGFGKANPVPYSPDSRLKNLDNSPCDIHPPGVDEAVAYNSREEALAGAE